jgi:hypothetical protein
MSGLNGDKLLEHPEQIIIENNIDASKIPFFILRPFFLLNI